MSEHQFKIGDAVTFSVMGKPFAGTVHGKPYTKLGRGGGEFVAVKRSDGKITDVRPKTLTLAAG